MIQEMSWSHYSLDLEILCCHSGVVQFQPEFSILHKTAKNLFWTKDVHVVNDVLV